MSGEEKQLIDKSNSNLTSTPQGLNILAEAVGRTEDIKTFKRDNAAVEEASTGFTPIISTFVIKGRTYDKQTNETLQGVNLKLIDALYPMKRVEVTEGNFTYEYDENGVKEIKTDTNGEFEIRVGIPVFPNLNDRVLVQSQMSYDIDGYAPQLQTIVTGNGEVLSQLPPIGLVNLEKAAEIEAASLKNEANQAIQKVSNFVLNPIERSIVVIKNSVLTVTSSIQNKLFPLAIGLLIIFGITKLAQSGSAKCPNNTLLKLAIKRRNSIVKQLNNIYKIIALNTALVALFLYISGLFKQGKITISLLPIPLAVPPGIGLPYSVVSALENIKDLFEKFSDINNDLRKALIIALVFLIASLVIILRYLKKIDELIEKCAGGSGGAEGLGMTEINNELLAIGAESKAQGNPVVTNVNGFEMAVVVDQQSKTGELYKRRAIAKNSSGVTILKGDGSFSAEDQILIDELSFYIVQNNLKAD